MSVNPESEQAGKLLQRHKNTSWIYREASNIEQWSAQVKPIQADCGLNINTGEGDTQRRTTKVGDEADLRQEEAPQ